MESEMKIIFLFVLEIRKKKKHNYRNIRLIR